MTTRLDLNQIEPAAIQAMMGLEHYLADSGLNPNIKELIKLKASMINKCAYCIQMHSQTARNNGEDEQRIYALSAWQESPLYNKEERAILALTEEVTRIDQHGLSRKTYEHCITLLGEKTAAKIIMQVVTINAWNRIALACTMQHAS